MIHFYHGLFGSPKDWDGIFSQDTLCHNHNLYQGNIQSKLAQIIHKDDILIGYSIGGRIALEIAMRNNFNFQKLILISSHPGVELHEIEERKKWEDQTLKKMRTLSAPDFAAFWNGLPLFQNSKIDSEISREFLNASADLFESFKLSDYPLNQSQLEKYSKKITWITGRYDPKYHKLIAEKVSPLGIQTYVTETDHRVLSDKNGIIKILINEGIM